MASTTVNVGLTSDFYFADVAPFERWEATSEVFPDVTGVGDSEDAAVEDFIEQITTRVYQ